MFVGDRGWVGVCEGALTSHAELGLSGSQGGEGRRAQLGLRNRRRRPFVGVYKISVQKTNDKAAGVPKK